MWTSATKAKFSLAMRTYNKQNYYTGLLTTEEAECINNIIISAESGFEPAINLLLNDIFITLDEEAYTFSEKKLENMLEQCESNSGVIHYILGNIHSEKDCDGVKQNHYRKSMNSGFVLGKVGFSRFMFGKKKYAIALRYFLETLDHTQYNLLSNEIKSQIVNDISLCNYKLKDYDNFWKYNKKARKFGLAVSMNNAANAYMRGDGKQKNYKKALKLYKRSLEKGYDLQGWVTSQIEKCNKMLAQK